MKGKYLITTDNWFYAPDGLKYRAAWGDVEIIPDTTLGLQTNRNSTNWYAKVGSNESHLTIAGCQIHYAVRCEERPNSKEVKETSYDNKGFNKYTRPSEIYFAQ